MRIKQMTGRPVTGQQLIFQGRAIDLEDSLEKVKLTSGVVVQCFPKPTTDEDEADALRGESLSQQGGLLGMSGGGGRSGGGAIGMQPGRGLGGISGLMSMEDDRRSDGSGSAGRGAGLSQEDDEWENVGKKKKAAKAAGVAGVAGAALSFSQPGMSVPAQVYIIAYVYIHACMHALIRIYTYLHVKMYTNMHMSTNTYVYKYILKQYARVSTPSLHI
jgi:hypothetical protein